MGRACSEFLWGKWTSWPEGVEIQRETAALLPGMLRGPALGRGVGGAFKVTLAGPVLHYLHAFLCSTCKCAEECSSGQPGSRGWDCCVSTLQTSSRDLQDSGEDRRQALPFT